MNEHKSTDSSVDNMFLWWDEKELVWWVDSANETILWTWHKKSTRQIELVKRRCSIQRKRFELESENCSSENWLVRWTKGKHQTMNSGHCFLAFEAIQWLLDFGFREDRCRQILWFGKRIENIRKCCRNSKVPVVLPEWGWLYYES